MFSRKRHALALSLVMLASLVLPLWRPTRALSEVALEAVAEDALTAIEDEGESPGAVPVEEEDELLGAPLTEEQLGSIGSLDFPDEGEDMLGAVDELPLYESTGAVRALGFVPRRNEIWPLSSGIGFCYATATSEELDVYRYVIATDTSTKIATVPVIKHYQGSSYSYSSGNFAIFVTGDMLYYVEGNRDYYAQTTTYTLRRLNLANGSTSTVFAKSAEEIDGCDTVGVDPAGRVYWADYGSHNLYVYSQTGAQLATVAIPTVTIYYDDYGYDDSILFKFVGFDASNGNIYFTGTSNWQYWGFSHAMETLYVGNFDGSTRTLTLNEKPITILYQQGRYSHYGAVELLGDRYVADLCTFTGGTLAILDSHAIGVNDVTDSETTIDFGTGGVSVTTVALPADDVVFGTSTREGVYDYTSDVTGVGARCAYFANDDLLVVDKGDRRAVCYTLANGAMNGSLRTTYDIYKLMNVGGELAVIERDDDGALYLERFSMAQPTNIALIGATSLEVSGKADYQVSSNAEIVPEISFTSSDPTVLSIDAAGRASAHKEGTVTITATTNSGLTATRRVTVRGGGVSKTWPDVTVLSGQPYDNWNRNNYSTWSWPVSSYLAETSRGLMRVQARESDVLVEYYNGAGAVVSSKTVGFELPIFGGFFAGADGSNYLVFGQDNQSESDSRVVVRVVRYDGSWKRLSAYDLKGANTYDPFSSGSLRMDEADGRLYVHTCHKMYAEDDELHHQANMTLVIDEATMTLVDSYTSVMNLSTGYVSHSFNQFVRVADGVLYRADHGDYYPRGFALTAADVSGLVSEPFMYFSPIVFNDDYYSNYTGASLGGMELSDSCVLFAYNLDESYGNGPRNVYVAAQDRSFETNPVDAKLTSYGTDSAVSCFTPQLVRVNDRHALVMWVERNGKTSTYAARFALLDHSGTVVAGPVRKTLPLSDCQPIVLSDGSVAWYVSSNNKVALYTLNPYDLVSMSDDNFDGRLQVSLEDADIGAVKPQMYTGEELMPKPRVSINGSVLELGEDYTLSYRDNREIGMATITITGIGSYAGTRTVRFQIVAKRQGWKRLWGNGSLDTMEAIVDEGWADGEGGTVVVASNADFKDALAGAGLAGLYGGPVVLSGKNGLSRQAAAELERLKPSRVYVAGGTASLKPAVVSGIKDATGLKVREDNDFEATTGIIRIWGSGSAQTSANLAYPGMGKWADKTAIIATNKSFKDALSVAPISYAMHWPILLASNGQKLHYEVLMALWDLGIERVYIVGGEKGVSPYVEEQLSQWGVEVADRKWGNTGWETSRAIAEWGLSLGLSVDGMGYATSQNFPDALAGAALVGRNGSVLLLADQKAQGNLAFANEHANEITYGYIFGGESSFSQECYDQLPQ